MCKPTHQSPPFNYLYQVLTNQAVIPCLNYSKARYLGNWGQPLTGKPAEIINEPSPCLLALPGPDFPAETIEKALDVAPAFPALPLSPELLWCYPVWSFVVCWVSTPRNLGQHPPS